MLRMGFDKFLKEEDTGGVPLLTTIRSREQEFLQYIREMMHYQEVLHLLFWDVRTGAPKKGLGLRADVIGTMSTKKFAMSISAEMKTYVEELSQAEYYQQLSPITRKVLEHAKKEYDLLIKIPEKEFASYEVAKANASAAWEEAKHASDYSIFQPHLEKLVETNKRFIDYWGYRENPYNALLDQYDPGMTVVRLDEVFTKVKAKLIPLLHRTQEAKSKPDTTFLGAAFPVEKQKDFHHFLLRELGYDFGAGRLDETIHPFAVPLNRKDVRITTKFNESYFAGGLFATIHEYGHALYELNIADELIGTSLCTGTSTGFHESQSLLWEKMIGRSKPFWKQYYPTLSTYNQEQFHGVGLDDFYRAVNSVSPSFIRIEADELTYPLHVILRYEIEKGIFANEIEVRDLPEIWNQKMQEYLGIVPPDDRRGVLQDMHWSAGMFGYFPSYALGYLFAAQIRNTMRKEIKEIDQLVEEAKFTPIKQWLAENIHVHGKMKDPDQLLLEVTGEPLNSDHLLSYLEEKYSDIYKLDK